MRRHNRISGQYSARLIEMLESPSYRALSRAGHMVVSRIEIELAHHGGNDNGRLPVTTDDFVAYGMHRTSVAPAIREAEALGFIRVTRGRGGNSEYRTPNLFLLTFVYGRDARNRPPTHDWRRIKTPKEARETARIARCNKNLYAVEHGKESWRKRLQKQNTGSEKAQIPIRQNDIEIVDHPVRRTGTTGSDQKTVPLLYLGEGAKQPTPRRATSQTSPKATAVPRRG